MIENLGEVLSRQIRDGTDVAALRKFLMADNGCLLVATAPMHFDGITDIRQPFYDFFDIQMLEAWASRRRSRSSAATSTGRSARTCSRPWKACGRGWRRSIA